MTASQPYYVLAGTKDINACSPNREERGILACPTSSKLLAEHRSRPWHVSQCRGSFFKRRRQGLRFLLLDIESQNILYHLNQAESPRAFHSVLEVELPDDSQTRKYDDGHHDGVSDYSFCRGILSDRILIRRSYRLYKPGEVADLIEKGLYRHHDGALFSNLAAEMHGEWLIRNDEVETFQALEEHFNIDRLALVAAGLNGIRFFEVWAAKGRLMAPKTRDQCLNQAREKKLEDLILQMTVDNPPSTSTSGKPAPPPPHKRSPKELLDVLASLTKVSSSDGNNLWQYEFDDLQIQLEEVKAGIMKAVSDSDVSWNRANLVACSELTDIERQVEIESSFSDFIETGNLQISFEDVRTQARMRLGQESAK